VAETTVLPRSLLVAGVVMNFLAFDRQCLVSKPPTTGRPGS